MFYAERKARASSVAGDAIRARHRERLAARRVSAAELERVRERQKGVLKERARADFQRRAAEPKRIRWNALTRAERNAHRRERYRERRAIEKQDPVREARRRESRRQKARERFRQNPEAIREARRRYRRAHADEVNRKQREYRRARAERGATKTASTTADQAAQNWQAYRASHASGPTAEDAARGWRRMRESQGSPDPVSSPAPPAPEPAFPGSAARSREVPDSPSREPDFGP